MSIKPLNTHYSFENPASVYDEEAMTALELAGRQGAKINEIIEDQNNLRETTTQELKDQREKVIPNLVTNEVQTQIDNGVFDEQIDNMAGGLRAQMETYNAERVDDLATINARIDTFTALPSGSTSGDAELIDIRVGVDGVTAGTAGESVRRQFHNLPYPKAITKNQDVDLDTLTEPGWYLFSGCTILNGPVCENTLYYVRVELMVQSDTVYWIKQTAGAYNYPEEYTRVQYGGKWKDWMGASCTVEPLPGDDRDMAAVINRYLRVYGYCKLKKGDFNLKSQVQIPTGALLEGSGASSRLIHNSSTATLVTMASTSTIRNLTLYDPTVEEHPDASSAPGNRIGITISGETQNAIIDGLFIQGFNYAGIFLNETGTAVRSVMISNCDIKYCHVGLRLLASEYACVTGCVFRDNFIGCYNFGGNNKFSACGFDSNVWGFVVGGETNNGHGSAVGCSFNHNTERAISHQAVKHGFIYSGCQIHFGEISFSADCYGGLFSGCHFGRNVSLRCSTSHKQMFVGCTFYENPVDVEGHSDPNNALRFFNCYGFDGTQIGG